MTTHSELPLRLRIRNAVADYEAWREDRVQIFEDEAEQGHLDHDRIWASDDSGTDGYGALANLLEEVLKTLEDRT